MQVTDIFHMDVDICQLGMDQRRANMLARDVAEKLKCSQEILRSKFTMCIYLGIKERGFPPGSVAKFAQAGKLGSR